MWSNDIKCKCMFMFPLKHLARKGLKDTFDEIWPFTAICLILQEAKNILYASVFSFLLYTSLLRCPIGGSWYECSQSVGLLHTQLQQAFRLLKMAGGKTSILKISIKQMLEY